jgi:hypothetical protein
LLNKNGGGINMENYRPNSKASKQTEKQEVKKPKVEKIVKGTVKAKKKNGFLSSFLTGDILEIKNYVVDDVLIPAVKNTIQDIVTNGISMLLNNGEVAKGGRRSSGASRISYRDYYDRDDRNRNRDGNRYNRSSTYAYDDIILESRSEAEDVIARLDELIDVYGTASIADLYDLVGISGQYTDNDYGWTDLRAASHIRVRDGYLLKLPRAVPIK